MEGDTADESKKRIQSIYVLQKTSFEKTEETPQGSKKSSRKGKGNRKETHQNLLREKHFGKKSP